MRTAVTALILAISASGASAQWEYIDAIDMLSGSSGFGGATLDRDSRTLTIEKPGSLPPMSENVPHKVDSGGIGFATGPDNRGTPIGKCTAPHQTNFHSETRSLPPAPFRRVATVVLI